jgi:hypothetical protein
MIYLTILALFNFIVLATVITIINYDRKTFLVLTSGLYYKSCMIVIYNRNQSTIVVPVL